MATQEANLNRRERELNQRETELRRLETELRNRGGTASNKNWPKFCPIVRHDIAGEVPAAMQGMVRCAYWAFLVSGCRCVICCPFVRPLECLWHGAALNWAPDSAM